MKICNTCKILKPANKDYFVSSNKTKSKIGAQCRECHKKKMKLLNPINYKKNRENGLLRTYKNNDKKNNREFDITDKWLKENITSKPCFYCETTSDPIGADRIDNNLGHIKTNVIPCCKICNKTRNNHFSFNEMILIGRLIKQIKQARI